MKTETEESLRSSVNHENGDGSASGCSTEAEMEVTDRSFFFRRFFCFCAVELTSQTSKCKPVVKEAQEETEK